MKKENIYISCKKLSSHLSNLIYNTYYKRTFDRIMVKSQITKLEDFYPEVLISNLNNKFRCNSDILNNLFEALGLDSSFNLAFHMLEEKSSAKLDLNEEMKFNPPQQDLPPLIKELGTNLNAENYETAPALGRELEIKDLIVALMTPETSAILVGEPATGKTAIVEHLAYLINQGQVPKQLKDKTIIKINISSLVAGTMYRGSFEGKIERILNEAIQDENIILFFDEMHTAIGAGSASGTNLDLANILKPYLDRGKIKIIGATTEEEYEEFILSDEAFKRRFERIDIFEPNAKIVAEILSNRITKLEKATGVSFPYDTINVITLTNFLANATSKKNRNNKDHVNNPDLAIKIFSKAFAFASYENSLYVKVDHLAESIRRSTRLNEVARNRLATLLITKFSNPSKPNHSECQIIEFPKRV